MRTFGFEEGVLARLYRLLLPTLHLQPLVLVLDAVLVPLQVLVHARQLLFETLFARGALLLLRARRPDRRCCLSIRF